MSSSSILGSRSKIENTNDNLFFGNCTTPPTIFGGEIRKLKSQSSVHKVIKAQSCSGSFLRIWIRLSIFSSCPDSSSFLSCASRHQICHLQRCNQGCRYQLYLYKKRKSKDVLDAQWIFSHHFELGFLY